MQTNIIIIERKDLGGVMSKDCKDSDKTDASEVNDVRDLDKLFYVRAAATGKARSPAVERRVGGTTSVDDDDERRR